jgi:hypothetical protein
LHRKNAAIQLVRDRDYAVRYRNLSGVRLAFIRNRLWGRRAMLQVRSTKPNPIYMDYSTRHHEPLDELRLKKGLADTIFDGQSTEYELQDSLNMRSARR